MCLTCLYFILGVLERSLLIDFYSYSVVDNFTNRLRLRNTKSILSDLYAIKQKLFLSLSLSLSLILRQAYLIADRYTFI